jgi:hypothetical protein
MTGELIRTLGLGEVGSHTSGGCGALHQTGHLLIGLAIRFGGHMAKKTRRS